MIEAVRIVDNFSPQIDRVRQSALESGFGTWLPSKGEVGSSIYEGMNFHGLHSLMVASLLLATGTQVIPNLMFFRVTKPETERAYVHSDRTEGTKTANVYLSDHGNEISGTAFYRHRQTGLIEMPTFEQMNGTIMGEKLKEDMIKGGEIEWEEMDFVRSLYNRCVIFHAPLFHARVPKNGIGKEDSDARMVWVCHYHTDIAQLLGMKNGGTN